MRALNRLSCAVAALVGAVIAVGCIQASPRVVRIGFVAPFEGRYREIGDQVIPAARYAVQEYASRFPQDRLVIELVAYDDRGIPELAAEQARKLVADPEVAVVIGHWREETTQAAIPIYAEAGIPVITFSPADNPPGAVYNLAPSFRDMRSLAETWNNKQSIKAALLITDSDDALRAADTLAAQGLSAPGSFIGGPIWGLRQTRALINRTSVYFVSGSALPADLSGSRWTDTAKSTFVAGFEKSSLGAPPGVLSVEAYEATWLAISQVAEKLGIRGDFPASASLTFDQTGRRENAPVYLYHWDADQLQLVVKLR